MYNGSSIGRSWELTENIGDSGNSDGGGDGGSGGGGGGNGDDLVMPKTGDDENGSSCRYHLSR